MDFFNLKEQYKKNSSAINSAVLKVLSDTNFIMGDEVRSLEEKLSKYTQVKNVVTCGNGTDAIVLSLMALDIKRGDIVLCPSFSYFATAEAISSVGATPFFVDVELDSFNICPISLEESIKNCINQEKTVKAVITVDLFGLPANYPEITKIARKYKIKIIEDGAQGFGGSISEKKACSFGDISTTSFFPTKPLGCYGDGGAIFTDNDDYANRIRSLRVHGSGKNKYENIEIGMNSRLDTIQAAILLEKLKIFDHEIEEKQATANFFTEINSDKIITPKVPSNFYSSWALYTIKTDFRNKLTKYMDAKGIPTRIYYEIPIHLQKAYQYLGTENNKLKNTLMLKEKVLSIPLCSRNKDYIRECLEAF